MHSTTMTRALAIAAICAIAGACSNGGEYADNDSGATVADTTTAMAAGTTVGDEWSDAHILGRLSLVNGGRLAGAELADAKATNPKVKQLAHQIEQDHADMQQKLMNWSSQANVTPTLPSDSGLVSDRNEDISDLQTKDRGREWDEEFLDDLVDWQQKTRDLISEGSQKTQDAQLRQLLSAMQSTVEQHISDAKALREQLD